MTARRYGLISPSGWRPSTERRQPSEYDSGLFQLRGDGELSDALAGCREDRVADRRRDWRHARLPDAGWRSGARDEVHVRHPRRLRHPRHLVAVEVRLLNLAVRRCHLAHQRQARAEHRGAFELRDDAIRVDDRPGIDCQIDPRDRHLARFADFDFDDGSDVREEAPVSGQSEAAARAGLLLRPPGLFGDDVDDTAQSRGVERVPCVAGLPAGLTLGAEVDDPRRADQFQQVLDAVGVGERRELVGEALHRIRRDGCWPPSAASRCGCARAPGRSRRASWRGGREFR